MSTDAVAVLTALADPTRRRIFELVAEAARPVGALAAELPVSRPAVSQHLRVLRAAGLVREHRMGTRHVFGLDQGGLAALRAYLDRFWDESLAAFKEAAERPAQAPSPTTTPTHEEQR